MSNTGKRNSVIELLRILAIGNVIGSHYSAHGEVALVDMPFSINKYILQLTVPSAIGLILFVLITGYYQSQKEFRIKKVVNMLIVVGFYSLIFYGIAIHRGEASFCASELLNTSFSAISGDYWFISAYLALYILSPFLNHMICGVSAKQFQKLIAVLMLIWSVIPTFTQYSLFGYPMGEFVLLYLIGAYLRKFPDSYQKMSAKKILFFTLINIGFLCGSVLFFDALGYKMSVHANYFWGTESVFCICFAVGIFMLFLRCKPRYWSVVNLFSTTSLGVYIIHDNKYIRDWLWRGWIRNYKYMNKPTLVLHLLLSVICVFIVCAVIEIFRNTVFRFTIDPLINRVGKKHTDAQS